MAGTVIFLGAGATKSCGGPLTDEILPAVLSAHDSSSALIEDFFKNLFHVDSGSSKELFPGLPLVMSLLDTALDRRQAFHRDWEPQRVTELRHAIELRIFDLLEAQLNNVPTTNHWRLLQTVYPAPAQPCVISTNYDLLIDTAMMFVSRERKPEGGLPDYSIHFQTPFFAEGGVGRFGTLLKLHGSLNWLYCRTCQRIEIGASEAKKFLSVLGRLVGGPSLEKFYTPDGSSCPVCKTNLRPLLIAPTHLKDYRNPHLAQVWYEAERVLRDADSAVFIGYSLPDDDVEVVYLLKRGLAHLQPEQITVVEHDATMPPLVDHTVGRRYRTLFGDGIAWHPEGLDGWLPKAQASKPTAASAELSRGAGH